MLSRILVFIHHGSRIPDPATAKKEKGGRIIVSLITYKTVTKLTNIWVCVPGSEIRDPRSGTPDSDPQHCYQACHSPRICNVKVRVKQLDDVLMIEFM